MRWAGLGVGLAVLFAVLWLASEQHYRGCVEAAEARHPVGSASGGYLDRSTYLDGTDDPLDLANGDPLNLGDGGFGAKRRAADRARGVAIDGCSRLPF